MRVTDIFSLNRDYGDHDRRWYENSWRNRDYYNRNWRHDDWYDRDYNHRGNC